jgi:hypothetical protein
VQVTGLRDAAPAEQLSDCVHAFPSEQAGAFARMVSVPLTVLRRVSVTFKVIVCDRPQAERRKLYRSDCRRRAGDVDHGTLLSPAYETANAANRVRIGGAHSIEYDRPIQADGIRPPAFDTGSLF